MSECDDPIGQLEQMLGQKEVEIVLLKKFFRDLSLDDRIELVVEDHAEHGLKTCLRALGVSKGTWH